MSAMIKRIMAAAATAFLATVPAAAQLHESVSVEGRYIPEVIPSDRINALPQRVTFPVDATPIPYSTEGVTAYFLPAIAAMPPTLWQASRTPVTSRGYLEAALGSWLNANVSAGYRIINDEDTELSAMLQYNSTSLWRPQIATGRDGARRRNQDVTAGLSFAHDFNGAGRFEASLAYRFGWFNYYGFLPPFGSTEENPWTPTQSLNDLNFKAGWRSPVKREAINWHASAAVRYFGYRTLYRRDEAMNLISCSGLRETDVTIDGGILFPWDNGSTIGLDLNADVLIYSRKGLPVGLSPDNYGNVALHPFYRFTRGLLNVKVGAEVDLSFNAGNRDNRFSPFHIAPDVCFDWRKDPVGLYLHLKGGTELMTLAAMSNMDAMTLPTLSTTRPLYSPVDARLGANFGPFSGFSAGLSLAYRISDRVPLGGWYTAMLNSGSNPLEQLMLPEGSRALYSMDDHGLSVKGWQIGASLDYRLGKILHIFAEGTYQAQKGGRGYFNGFDRPRWTLDARLAVSPVDKLEITVGYGYRGVRRIYTGYTTPPMGGVTVNGASASRSTASMRLPDLTLLNASAAWSFTKNFRIFATAGNIIGGQTTLLPQLPGQGFTAEGGVSLLF